MKNLKILVLLVLFVAMAAGCATRSHDSRVACAAAGAAGGAAIGGIADDSEGALAGALVGGIIGYVFCPNTVAAAPEPAPEPEPAPGDADGDGVTDDRDRCPTTPAGAKVDANGCELDSDGDGVVDSRDACPGTPAGVKVDSNGCEIVAKVISLDGVFFHTNSAELKGDSYSVLDSAAGTLTSMPNVSVEVAGHTDSQGDAGYNQNLSQQRAETVRSYLISKGVSASRLSATGYGESQPVADNSSSAGRAQNRRVE